MEYLQAQEKLVRVTTHALMTLAEEKRRNTWCKEKEKEVWKKSEICLILYCYCRYYTKFLSKPYVLPVRTKIRTKEGMVADFLLITYSSEYQNVDT